MVASAFDSGPGPAPDGARPTRDQPPGDAGADAQDQTAAQASEAPAEARLLEKVLEQTLSSMQTGEATDAADLEALRAVARRHRGKELTLEPVAVELVRAMLATRFNIRADAGEPWATMSVTIAQSLYDDPYSAQRLADLWRRLLNNLT